MEQQIVLKLVGDEFPEREKLCDQLKNCEVEDLAEGNILNFRVWSSEKFETKTAVLGEGSFYDLDGVPVVLTILQRNGLLWTLDISRADSRAIKAQINPDNIRAFGYRRGLDLGH
jgi:hypothetical protein